MNRLQQLNQLRSFIARANTGFALRAADVPDALLDLPIFTVSEHYWHQAPDLPGLLFLTEDSANAAAASFNADQPLDSRLRAAVESTSLRRIIAEG